jgi:hypothetical protein
LPQSDKVTLTEHFVRHGNTLTHITITRDAVYLTEPLVKSQNFVMAPRELPQENWLWVCQPVVEIADRRETEVPAYMPNENPFLGEFRTRHNVPEEAARGGAETMYPEFASRPKSALTVVAPALGAGLIAPQPTVDNAQIEIVPVRPNVFMLVGAGSNITVMTGDEGVLVVDTQLASMSDKVLSAIRSSPTSRSAM